MYFIAYWLNSKKAEEGLEGLEVEYFDTEKDLNDKLDYISVSNALLETGIQVFDYGQYNNSLDCIF